MTEPRTELEKAEAAQNDFIQAVQGGHPWVSNSTFRNNPGFDLYVKAAFESWVHLKLVAEQSKPAKRVSLTEVSNGKDAGDDPAQ